MLCISQCDMAGVQPVNAIWQVYSTLEDIVSEALVQGSYSNTLFIMFIIMLIMYQQYAHSYAPGPPAWTGPKAPIVLYSIFMNQ